MKRTRSQELYEQSKKIAPAGVHSPVRAFRAVGGHPIFFEKGSGSQITDVDGNTYVDYVGAWGPAILGHAPEFVVSRCMEVLKKGPLFGTPHELELELARKIVDTVPSIEKIRFVNSGTEAVMSS
ncbi:MAG: aminotransferase class III-fold pyridoxal phosphate-dependent enzyme, partial [Bdellovibrionales bacterium]|nr:aminotransferase class III-fold pyridoxal phosphate-dependent enzyme [Bdellovibrionales bacterium]